MASKRPAKTSKTEPTKKPPTDKTQVAGKTAPARKRAASSSKAKELKKDSSERLLHKALTPKEARFVDEFLVDCNATQAAIRAKYSEKSARQIGHENLSKPHIQAAIANARAEQQKRTQITADRVLELTWRIVNADPREIVEVRVGCCRHCYGEGHKYQRTLSELNHDREKWLDEGKPLEEFDEQGGIGFDPRKLPNSDCPQCGGTGYARLVLHDTRHISPEALALYAGAKEGKYGIEVQLYDRTPYMEKLFRHLGLYERDNQQAADGLASLLHRIAQEGGNGFKPIEEDPEKPPVRAPLGQVQHPDALDDDDDDDDGQQAARR